jgi:hydroxymethylpyrimidine pyrophosphatase-like HAD family hydrolase
MSKLTLPTLFLDIDGTLLHSDHSRWGYGLAPGAIDFLE